MIVGFALLFGPLSLVHADPAAGLPPPPAGELLPWTSIKGRTIRAAFVKLENDQVFLREENGKAHQPLLDQLSPASRRQAIEESKKRADLLIESVRAMAFVPVKRGRFTMGSPPGEAGCLSSLEEPLPGKPVDPAAGPVKDWEPLREVGITRDFWLKETEVTWEEWNRVRERAVAYGYTDLASGRNGYQGDESGDHPVTEITWWDAIKWCNAKSQIEGKTPVYLSTDSGDKAAVLKTGTPVPKVRWEADGYRLPTEAEWEYACRDRKDADAGNSAFHSGPISSTGVAPLDPKLDEVAWYGGNSGGNTRPAKGKTPNKLGLHDMHGNVAEWCWDWVDLVEAADVKDPRGPEQGFFLSFRGGSWADPARCCRAAYRGSLSPICSASYFVGFRPACGVDPSADSKAAAPGVDRRERKSPPSPPNR
jgi:formylglycine-generating enzyme required for sulfatase activity